MKKPIYKRWWFIALCLLVLALIGNSESLQETADEEIAKHEQEGQMESLEPQATLVSEISEDEPATEAQEKLREQEKSEEQAEANLDPVTEGDGKEHSVLDLDPYTLEALSIAKKELNCNEDELFYEEIVMGTYLVNLGYDAGSGLISTLDSLLIIDGQIVARMMDESITYEEYQEIVESVRNGAAPPQVDSTPQASNTQTATPQPSGYSGIFDVEWEITDTDFFTNGNYDRAYNIFKYLTDADVQYITWITDDIGRVNRSAWNYYGQMMEINGTIISINMYPPGSEVSDLMAEGGELSEFQLYYEDYNVWASVLVRGSVDVSEGEKLIAVGMPVGYYSGANMFGGEVTNLVFCGVAN